MSPKKKRMPKPVAIKPLKKVKPLPKAGPKIGPKPSRTTLGEPDTGIGLTGRRNAKKREE